jgi:hypothetical protein
MNHNTFGDGMANTEVVIKVPDRAALAHCHSIHLFNRSGEKVLTVTKIGEITIITGLNTLHDSVTFDILSPVNGEITYTFISTNQIPYSSGEILIKFKTSETINCEPDQLAISMFQKLIEQSRKARGKVEEELKSQKIMDWVFPLGLFLFGILPLLAGGWGTLIGLLMWVGAYFLGTGKKQPSTELNSLLKRTPTEQQMNQAFKGTVSLHPC